MKDRLAKFMKTEGLSSSRFADVMGIPPSSVSHLLSGRNKPGFDFIAKMIMRFPKLNPDWLILGSSPMYRPSMVDDVERRPSSESVDAAASPERIFPADLQPAVPAQTGYSSEQEKQQSLMIPALPEDPGLQREEPELFAPPEEPLRTAPSLEASAQPSRNNRTDDKPQVRHHSEPQQQQAERLPTDIHDQSKSIERVILFFEDHTFSLYTPGNK